MVNGTEQLRVLEAQVEDRVRQTVTAHPDWPCCKGCDACCRSLANIPRLTLPEWDSVQQAMAQLPSRVQAEIHMRIQTLTAGMRPIVCPFLDLDEGSCRIYPHRPVACRTYGFYHDRDGGLFCSIIERSAPDDVVWGNQAAVDARLRAIGPDADLITWLNEDNPF